MSKMARNKGKRGEREIADIFIELMQGIEKELWKKGYSEEVKRNTLQSDRGGYDIVGIPGLAIEVKRQEVLQLGPWWQQTLDQAKGAMPVLIYRASRQPWRVRTITYVSVAGSGVYSTSDISIDDFMKAYDIYYRSIL
jgi:hypothetical protein